MKEIEEKKKKVALRMNKRDIVEGDKDDGSLTSFNRRDIQKEKATRKAKNSNLKKGGDWET